MRAQVTAILAFGLALAACGGRRAATLPSADAGTAAPLAIDSLWMEAQRAFRSGKWSNAQRHLDQLVANVSPSDPRYLRLRFYLGETLLAQGQHLMAVREFRRVADERPDDPLAPDALTRAGDAYADLWRRPELDPTYAESARSVYREVLTRYPGTVAAGRAALQLAELNEKFAFKEYKNALFYYRYKAYDSAILLLRSMLAEYPRARIAPAALEKLVRSYRILGYAEDVRQTCAYIAEYHPDPAGPIRFCPKPASADTGSTGALRE